MNPGGWWQGKQSARAWHISGALPCVTRHVQLSTSGSVYARSAPAAELRSAHNFARLDCRHSLNFCRRQMQGVNRCIPNTVSALPARGSRQDGQTVRAAGSLGQTSHPRSTALPMQTPWAQRRHASTPVAYTRVLAAPARSPTGAQDQLGRRDLDLASLRSPLARTRRERAHMPLTTGVAWLARSYGLLAGPQRLRD